MDLHDESSTEPLEIQAFKLFLAVRNQPGDPQPRERLIDWLRESPAHWRAFQSLDHYLFEAAVLLADVPLDMTKSH